MAIGRLSVKVGKAGKAAPHASYIGRTGQYAKRLERGEKLEASEYGNMPKWAESNPNHFWEAADANERKNGTTYREYEIALPREMTPAQRLELVQDFVKQEIGDRYPYQFAIHNPRASDGGEQPHAHIMFSERGIDGIDRDPEQYFKRYNAKNPERGGAKKDNTGKDPATRRKELKELRGRWEVMCNEHLANNYIDKEIDMRSHAERGTGLEPEAKQLPSQWRDPQQRAEVIKYREIRVEQAKTIDLLRQYVPNAKADLAVFNAARAEQAKAVAEGELVKEWNNTKKENVYSRANRANELANKLTKRAESINSKRAKMQREHAKGKPQEPTGLLAAFKRKAYGEAYAEWEKRLKQINRWGQREVKKLITRAKKLRDYAVNEYKVTSSVDRKMTLQRPNDAQTVKRVEQQQREAREQIRKQQIQEQMNARNRSRSRGRDDGYEL
ncbi:MobA/MobL family protein [Plesiomonas shigelloides]|uniref:MobA/MobL family protein n=1 Tax=Plesiomonas shigelloides TaxID=703 RepID=UPI001261CA09|nr:MobA/MobL family protein [Plesiomonas shigelloides]KAB7692877.1 MobA/MobL family protein [Plesiomonas shigelloides]